MAKKMPRNTKVKRTGKKGHGAQTRPERNEAHCPIQHVEDKYRLTKQTGPLAASSSDRVTQEILRDLELFLRSLSDRISSCCVHSHSCFKE